MDSLTFIIAILATWRLSAMLSYETGPFDVFIWMREAIGIDHDDDGEKISNDGSFLASLFDCIWCLSWWVGLALSIVLFNLGLTVGGLLFLYPFALSAGAVIVEKINHGN